jgi:hypothetical protein
MSEQLAAEDRPTAIPQPRSRLWPRVLAGMAAGTVLGLVAMAAIVISNQGLASPLLTPELFEAAKSKWKEQQPSDYNIEVVVQGNQPATYYVEVRGGDAQLALRNGKPLAERRTFGTWSVPGMFATMSRDVDALARRAAGQQDRSVPNLNLRATFDPRYGYPAKYRRLEYRSSVEVAWEVTRFDVLPGERGALGSPRRINYPPTDEQENGATE